MHGLKGLMECVRCAVSTPWAGLAELAGRAVHGLLAAIICTPKWGRKGWRVASDGAERGASGTDLGRIRRDRDEH